MVAINKIKFAIPSYKRLDIIQSHTLAVLELFKIPKNQIYIFVVADEYESYSVLSEYNIVIGVLGLANQRNFISNYFKEGQMLVCLDDDLKSFQMLDKTQIIPITTHLQFKSFILRAFNLCIHHKSYLWGIHQTYNPRYMRESITFNFSFVVGHFWGCINRHHSELNITMDIKEDYERTIKYWLKDKVILKVNYIAASNAIYKTKGGLQETYPDRTEASIDASNTLINSYPEYFELRNTQLNNAKKSLYQELKLKKHSSITNFYKPLENINIECSIVKNLLDELEKANLPIYKKRENTGIGITHTFGLNRARKKCGLFESKNNSKYPELYKAILEYAVKYVNPHIEYTGIQVNKNYKTKAHYDARNANTDSYIVGLGNYTNGNLILNSYKVDIKYKPILFNGANWLHSTNDFEGTRYSLVFFKQN
jgi:hypothetical protein